MQTLIINLIRNEHLIFFSRHQAIPRSSQFLELCRVLGDLSIYECRRELEVVHNEKADTSFIYGTYDTVLIAYSAITLRL